MKRYKILFVISNYIVNGGGTRVLNLFYERVPLVSQDSVIYAKKYISCNRPSKYEKLVRCSSGKEVVQEFFRGNYDLIHWFKSDSNEIFNEIINEIKNRGVKIPIVTTILQNPSYCQNLLSPKEIQYSNLLVFIDKAAFAHPLYSFIPQDRKRQIYCCLINEADIKYIDEIKVSGSLNREKDIIIYGRGSTLNKCPSDMFERVFDKIENPKLFKIIGSGDRVWIDKKIEKRKGSYEVQLYDNLPYEEWLKQLSTFDVFLYYLPKDAYSSIDGTLGQAMLMGIPVVYYGPEAPKERFENGFNGLVTDNVDEIAILCNKLAKDKQLREYLGSNARTTTLKQFSLETTIQKYAEVYEHVCGSNLETYKVPRDFTAYYNANNRRLICQSIKSLPKRALRKLLRILKISK